MKGNLSFLRATLACAASLFLGFHMGRVEQLSAMTLEEMSQFGSFLAGLTGLMVAILAALGFSSWKASLKANIIAERVAKSESELESVIGKFFEFARTSVTLARHKKLYDEEFISSRHNKITERRELEKHMKTNYRDYMNLLGSYKVQILGLSVFLGHSLDEVSSDKLHQELQAVDEKALNVVATESGNIDFGSEQTKLFEKFKSSLFSVYPFQ